MKEIEYKIISERYGSDKCSGTQEEINSCLKDLGWGRLEMAVRNGIEVLISGDGEIVAEEIK